ncbi:hypothetical protein HANVADRAFT_52286 [Hanseniaspora valbyensis NRRL Y-1626]|uniref:Uncharacterized protein n=1 Tax=Hanseniaspora valbyensis NRRL Y-1626 TaxID=766949 RepID=A0A1B7TFP0_9ASCO|nr:hypothetical protein HANVADRAFT_52286 [Hanseniaspora valbyensis NRRL Y-1626]
MDSIKSENRKKFQQSQKYNNNKNKKYKYKHGITAEGKNKTFNQQSTENSSSNSEREDNESNNDDKNIEEDIDVDEKLQFVKNKKKASNNAARYDQVFDEDTEEYKQQQKLMKELDDAEYQRQLKLQNEYIEKNYKNKKEPDDRVLRTPDRLMNMTTEEMNNLLLSKDKKDDFKSKLFNEVKKDKQEEIEDKNDNKTDNSVKTKSFIDSRNSKIPTIPIALTKTNGETKPKKNKNIAVMASEDFLDSII